MVASQLFSFITTITLALHCVREGRQHSVSQSATSPLRNASTCCKLLRISNGGRCPCPPSWIRLSHDLQVPAGWHGCNVVGRTEDQLTGSCARKKCAFFFLLDTVGQVHAVSSVYVFSNLASNSCDRTSFPGAGCSITPSLRLQVKNQILLYPTMQVHLSTTRRNTTYARSYATNRRADMGGQSWLAGYSHRQENSQPSLTVWLVCFVRRFAEPRAKRASLLRMIARYKHSHWDVCGPSSQQQPAQPNLREPFLFFSGCARSMSARRCCCWSRSV